MARHMTGTLLAAGPTGRGVLGGGRVAAFLELTKPRITQLVVLTAAAGFFLAARQGLDSLLLAHALLGTALVAGGTNALNQVWERELDALMHRTRRRPLPAGRLSTTAGVMFGAAIALGGIVYLGLAVNLVTAFLASVTLASYVFLYTPLKRRTPLNTLIGAVPGALPIVGGWTAAGGSLDAAALALFGIVFLWQLPHFLALAWLYREDYARAGFRMPGARDPNGGATGQRALLFAAALLPVSLAPTALGVTGSFYSWGAAALGVGLLAGSAALAIGRSRTWARRLFASSVLYLPLLLLLMAVDRIAA
jgi:protoheme IX farnesyltransferase